MAEEANSQHQFKYGGQAIIEGVMMRSPHWFSISCRRPDGTIVTRVESVDRGLLHKLAWLNRPFLRGTLALIDAMALGSRALIYSAHVQLGEEERVYGEAPGSAEARKQGKISDIAIGGTAAASALFGIFIFLILPSLITDFSKHRSADPSAGFAVRVAASLKAVLLPSPSQTPVPHQSNVQLNLRDGVTRVVILFAYLFLISLLPRIRRVFMYHGAEHKAINALEQGVPLTPDAALQCSRFHPRCGTNFIVLVMIVNIIAFAFLPRPVWYLRLPLHLPFIALVAGVAYEMIRLAGKHWTSPIVRALFAPGIATQALTTREPDALQIEVALAALQAVIDRENQATVPEAEPDEADPAAVIA